MDYERALGNSVVPQCAEVVGHVIKVLQASAASAHAATQARKQSFDLPENKGGELCEEQDLKPYTMQVFTGNTQDPGEG